MNSNLPPFSVTIYYNTAEFYVQVKDDFRAGTHMAAFQEAVQALAASVNYKVVLDLSQITYWDSDGMNFADLIQQIGSVKLPYDPHLKKLWNLKFGRNDK